MPRSGCSALHGLNPNLKKKKKNLSNFWRTLEIPLINCEVNLILTLSKDCVITNSTGEGKFAITETKLYVPVVTLSTKDNQKLLQQLKS